MALIHCPECGKEVSSNANNCPNCGHPLKSTKFCKYCGEAIDKDCVVCPKCGKQVENLAGNDKNIIINNNNNNNNSSSASASAAAFGYVGFGNMVSPKSRLVALLLCFFLGVLGVHRFYVGKVGTGILMILLMFVVIGEIWLLIDFIMILVGSFTDSQGLKVKNW